MLNIKPSHKAIKNYYRKINKLSELDEIDEGAVSPPFASLLRHCSKFYGWTLVEKYSIRNNGNLIYVDGALVDNFKLVYGIWEAKDTKDDLGKEIKKKFDKGYPKRNTLFQAPNRVILWQDGKQILDLDITNSKNLIEALNFFFRYQPPAIGKWKQAVEEFKQKVPALAEGLLNLIRQEKKSNKRFIKAFNEFDNLCRLTINPNISIPAIEEMLIQHILTERIFRKVFNNPDFVNNNIIARKIDKVIQALTSKHFSRHDFLKPLNRFYVAIETTATSIDDFSQKQDFLNNVYEKFFQGFSVKVADTHGIVYTPQPLVNFIVKSVNYVLIKEFKCSLSDENIHILDPFVGTGNFILRIMHEIKKTRLSDKYDEELHCNEVMLLPYYIASMNLEHSYYELTGEYKPFQGICFVDTFEIAESSQRPMFIEENTKRVEGQKSSPIFVIIGNPPYNAGQVNENDNNKNRRYPVIDKKVSLTYGKDSKATLVRKLNDPYVKAIRWASDRIGEEGIIAFVSNSSFITEISFDGMRKNLEQDFDEIYLFDLGGSVRDNPKLSGTTHNVFGIQVGVSINVFIRKKNGRTKKRIYYSRVDEYWRREQKYDYLEGKKHIGNIKWKKIKPDKNHNWLYEGLRPEFNKFIPLGTKTAKRSSRPDTHTLFKNYSLGVSTNRDYVAFDYNKGNLKKRVRKFCDNYNSEVNRYIEKGSPKEIDDFVNYDLLKWSRNLKRHLKKGDELIFNNRNIRLSLYRPYTKKYLYFSDIIIDEPGSTQNFFPNISKTGNRVICVSGLGSKKEFQALMVDMIPCLDMLEKTQCFPFYTYEGTEAEREENITDWALKHFRLRYKNKSISKWDIFHYVYAILHHPDYRKMYAANLKRNLPNIPFLSDFNKITKTGAKLAELHISYEDQTIYELEYIENSNLPLNLSVEKMKLSKDKKQLIYNEFLALSGIPSDVFEYRLGNRSALEWVIDQYRIKTDDRSGTVVDPNQIDKKYILELIGKVINISLKTVEIMRLLSKEKLPKS